MGTCPFCARVHNGPATTAANPDFILFSPVIRLSYVGSSCLTVFQNRQARRSHVRKPNDRAEKDEIGIGRSCGWTIMDSCAEGTRSHWGSAATRRLHGRDLSGHLSSI